MRRILSLFAAAAAVVVSLALPEVLLAQAAGLGSLSGFARTSEGSPLPQIALDLTGAGRVLRVIVGPDGHYRLDALEEGDYHVSCRVPGLVLKGEGVVHVASGAEAHLDLSFAPAPVREHVVVAATRDEAPTSILGVSATVVDAETLGDVEGTDLVHVLEGVPGVAVARAGGLGLDASVFVRGGESNYARVMVDGVPVNEAGGAYNFGSLLPLELDRVEVVRGSASSLYGSDALSGVVDIVTRGAGATEPFSVTGEAEGGTFDWRRWNGGTSGREGAFDWNLGATRATTDNEVPNSHFSETAAAAALGVRLSSSSTVRLVFRGDTERAGTPGPTAFGRPDLDAYSDSSGLVLGSDLRIEGGSLVQNVRLGFAKTNQLSVDPEDSGAYTPSYGSLTGAYSIADIPDPLGFEDNERRATAGYQADILLGGTNQVSVGADVERESGDVGERSGGIISPARTNGGVYLQDRMSIGESVFVTLGGRVERNDSFGWKAVPRAALAWRLASSGAASTTLRASGGAGINEPSFLESFGVSFYAQGNPNLKPERSQTFDLGVEQRAAGDRLRAAVTVFHQVYLDQIAYEELDPTTFQGTYVNLGKTRAQGLEASLEAAPARGVRLGGSYTYTDGKIVVSSSDFDPVYAAGLPLLRRPRHQGSVWARIEVGRFTVSGNVLYVGERTDSDFVGLGLTENAAYTRVDARAHVRLTRDFEVFLAGENILDERYMEVLGYPALSRSLRGGIRFRKALGS